MTTRVPRTNPLTGKYWKSGDIREDGMVFQSYSCRLDSDGFNYLNFLTQEAMERSRSDSKKRKRLLRASQRSLLRSIKSESGCMTCGYNKSPCVLTFDHRDRATKSFTISNSLGRFTTERLLEEVDKCDVLCFNCHMEKDLCQEKE